MCYPYSLGQALPDSINNGHLLTLTLWSWMAAPGNGCHKHNLFLSSNPLLNIQMITVII